MYTCCKSEKREWMGSSRAGRVRRHAIEWDAGLRREGGTRAWTKAYRKNSPLSYFTRTTSDARRTPAAHIPLPSFRSHRRRFPPRGILTLRTPYLAHSPRIRSSPSISRPLLFLLSICALSGRFEARWKLRDKSWNVRTHTYVPSAHIDAWKRMYVRV